MPIRSYLPQATKYINLYYLGFLTHSIPLYRSHAHRQRAQPGLRGGHGGDDVGAGGRRGQDGDHHHPHARLHHPPLPAREVIPRQQHQGHWRAGHPHQDEEC